MEYRSLNPATEELLKTYLLHSGNEIEEVLTSSTQAFHRYRDVSAMERKNLLNNLGTLLEKNVAVYARLITTEMGKPLKQATAEVLKCASCAKYFATHGDDYLQSSHVTVEDASGITQYEPLGPLFAIMPWNFPFWQVFRFSIPAIFLGNTVVLKHAPNTPQCALAIEAIFKEAGFLSGVFSSLFLSNEQAAEVIADTRIQGITLTGSTRAGQAVAEVAGRNIKKTVLELGGNDPFIVLSDADIEKTLAGAILAKLQNGGQSCIAAKRFLIHDSLFDRFSTAFIKKMSSQIMGDPLQEKVTLGPLARKDLRDTLDTQVKKQIKKGLKVLVGGEIPKQTGFFYPPTVIAADPKNGILPDDEELFGPVATLLPYRTESEMLEIANGTKYGLGASIWTSDIEKGKYLASKIMAGSVFINRIVRSDPRLPFGGVKCSGYGRELGLPGALEFANIKTIVSAVD